MRAVPWKKGYDSVRRRFNVKVTAVHPVSYVVDSKADTSVR